MVAVILASPGATLVAKPDEDMVAALVVSLAHVTLEVISAVEPSEYVPVAENCWLEPTFKLAGEAGAIVMEDNVDVGVTVVVNVDDWLDVFVDEHAAIPIVKTAINPRVKHELINPSCFLFIAIFLQHYFCSIALIAVGNYF